MSLTILLCVHIALFAMPKGAISNAVEEAPHDGRVQRLEDAVFALQTSVAVQNHQIQLQDEINKAQSDKIQHQDEIISELKEKNRLQDVELAQPTSPETRNGHNALGCLTETLTLSCHDNRLINVTYAEYGQYLHACDGGCCAPNPAYDCTEDVAENAPEDFVYIKFLCDNQISCSYQYEGSLVSECEAGYIADYMQIFFDCLPAPNEPVVGFTAWASETRAYSEDEVVLFDQVHSNFGGHYNPTTSSFNCPYHGTYMFSVNAMGYFGTSMGAQIMKDSTPLATAYSDSRNSWDVGSALVITECFPGQVVWIVATISGTMHEGDSVGYSHLSGYLMQGLE